MDVCITLSDADLQRFIDGMRGAQAKAAELEPASIVSSARKLLGDIDGSNMPDFVVSRFKHMETMIAMVEDVGFGLPDADRANVLAALTYFSSPDDIVPDDVPVLGYIDDAIMIELCVRELKHEIEAYNDFCRWRDNEATRRGESSAEHRLTRVEWAEKCRSELIERMHRRREESYVSGETAPGFFRVH
jgi:uncharacterized membrane protein YkvA (DUF1232 family)